MISLSETAHSILLTQTLNRNAHRRRRRPPRMPPPPHTIPTITTLLDEILTTKSLLTLQLLHCSTIKLGISHNEFIRSKLISSYASCSQISDAACIFSLSNRKSTFLYNTLLRSFANLNQFEQSIALFERMVREKRPIDGNTLPAVLRAVGGVSVLRIGVRVHVFGIVNGFGSDLGNCNGLVSMYGKCGDLVSAQKVFDGMSERNLVSWSAMMGAYVKHGEWREVFGLFERMVATGVWPDEKVFTTVLNACGHGGMVEEGREWFGRMRRFGVSPTLEHFTCMVDLLGRAGRIEEAKELMEGMEMEPDDVLWRAFLGVCKMHGVVDVTVRGRCVSANVSPLISSLREHATDAQELRPT
ncbi:hypothetical protein Droror1_Dr00023124 [Drosera rotundifolia]